MVKVFIDPGHGGIDSGSSGNGLLEKNVTLQLALAVRKYLGEYKDVSFKMSRTTNKTVTLQQRTNAANSWSADFFLSIHINAGGGTGFESYIYSGLSNSGETGKKRNIIHDMVHKANRMIDRGKKQANFHVLRETKMAAVLTENGFIDTKKDANKMKENEWIDRVARAHAEGIAEIYKLKKETSTGSSADTGKYTLRASTPGYYTAKDAKNKTNRKTTVPKGAFLFIS